MPTRPSPLVAEFEPADAARWRAMVEKGLKGRAFDGSRRDHGRRPGDRASLHGRRRGVRRCARPAPSDDPERPWDLRTVVEHPDPARANEQTLQDLNGGAQSVLVRLDPAGQRRGRRRLAGRPRPRAGRRAAGAGAGRAGRGLAGPRGGQLAGGRWPRARRRAAGLPHGPALRLRRGRRAVPAPIESHLIAAAQSAGAPRRRLSRGDRFPGLRPRRARGRRRRGAGTGLRWPPAPSPTPAPGRDAGLPARRRLRRASCWASRADADYFAALAKLRAARVALGPASPQPRGVEAPARIEARSSRRMLTDARPLDQPAAPDRRRLRRGRRRRGRRGAGALHRRPRPAHRLRPPPGAQHPARADGRGPPGPRRRSGRRLLVPRAPHRRAGPRRLGRVPGHRGRGRR